MSIQQSSILCLVNEPQNAYSIEVGVCILLLTHVYNVEQALLQIL